MRYLSLAACVVLAACGGSGNTTFSGSTTHTAQVVGKVTSRNGFPLALQGIAVTCPDNAATGVTGADGSFALDVPADTPFRVEFDDPRIGLTAKRDYAMIMLMVRLFLRATETISLRWNRFVESDGRRFITFTGKGRKEGRLVVPDDVWEVLQSWRRAFEAHVGRPMAPADPLFVAVAALGLKVAKTREGDSPLSPLCRGSLGGIVQRRINAIDIVGPRYGPHCLRATGAVLAFKAGASPMQVCAALRHASLATTMLYLEAIMGTESASAIDSVDLDVPEWVE